MNPLPYLPTPSELAALWPFWIICLLFFALHLYGKYKDAQAWKHWQSRMQRREIAHRIALKIGRN